MELRMKGRHREILVGCIVDLNKGILAEDTTPSERAKLVDLRNFYEGQL